MATALLALIKICNPLNENKPKEENKIVAILIFELGQLTLRIPTMQNPSETMSVICLTKAYSFMYPPSSPERLGPRAGVGQESQEESRKGGSSLGQT